MILNKLIDRPIMVTMLLLSVVVMGLVSLRILPVSLIPEMDIPYITVQVTDESMSAREMDESVIKPLRERLIQVNGLQEIVCESRDGAGTVRLSFNHGSDIGYLFIEVNEKIDRAMSSLPKIERPKVMKADASDIPAFFLNVMTSSDEDMIQLSRFCREVISKRLEQLPQVAMVDMSGGVGEEILIVPDEKRLAQAGLSVTAFENVISSANIRLGTLTIRDGEYQYNVKFDTKAGSVEELGAIWVKCNDRLHQIKDLADISLVPAKRTGAVRSDGQAAISLAVIKQSEARMGDLKKSVDNLIGSFKSDYPQLSFTITRDQTLLLEYSIRSLAWSIFVGVLLACIVIFLFMQDLRSPTLVSLTIPSALIFSMLLFYMSGLSLNIISLSGLLLGVGMMVDNTIILIDNISTRWMKGEQLREAVLNGTKDVLAPMLSSVLTTCAVFIPLVFVSGMAGALFSDEAFAVTTVMVTSYVVTITVIPVFYYWWYKGQVSFKVIPFLQKFSFDEPMRRWDHRRMEWWLDNKTLAWCLVAVATLGLFLGLTFMRKERLPDMTMTESILKLDWNERLPIEENIRRCALLESEIKQLSKQTTALVGAQQYVLGHSGDQGISELQLYFRCESMSALSEAQQQLETYLNTNAPDANWSFEPSGNIFDIVFVDKSAPLVAKLRPVRRPEVGLEELRRTLNALENVLPGVTIQALSTKEDVLFIADDQKMALYNVSFDDLISVLKNSMNENRLFSIVQGNRTIPVVLGWSMDSLSSILSDTFVVKGENRIPAMELMRQTYIEELKTFISGAEGSYYPVELNIKGHDIHQVMDAVNQAVREIGDFDVSFGGSWFTNRNMVHEMILILLVSLLLLYLILASQFESLLQPFVILLEVVVDIFGAIAILWILGESINLMSLIGFIVVTGIVINDSILKIDTINKLRRRGLPLRDAILTASSMRMKAIVMTSLTTVLAVLPFLARGSMGADLQYPMSLVIISGMVIGTFVSLFVVPALYYSLYAGKEHS